MYPFFRMLWQMNRAPKTPVLGLWEEHVSHHICWPWDLDFWFELNNGRTLTLFDLGRLPLAKRIGMIDALKRRRWGMTVAGSSVRYRRRVRAFDKVTMRSRGIGFDDKFMYIEQSMWRPNGDCTSHALLRMAVTGKEGIVPPSEMARELGHEGPSPDLPKWANEWIAADAIRPWPPMQA